MLKKIIKFLSSIRFTIVLICLLGVIFLLGLWIPQKSLVQALYSQWKENTPRLVAGLDALQLTSIHTSPITLFLWTLFFINLALVMWQRIPLLKKRIELSESRIADPVAAPGYFFKRSYDLPAALGPALIERLRTLGFAVVGGTEGFYGVKNRRSPIAFALFHLSFFLILLGGIVGVYTKFDAFVDLTQGEVFLGELERYSTSPTPNLPKIGAIPKVSFLVEKIVPRVAGNTPTGIDIQIVDNLGVKHEAGINIPYVADGAYFVFKHLGVSPLLVLKDPTGNVLDGAYQKLDVMMGKRDHFMMGGFDFIAHFFPDYELKDGVAHTRSQEFNNPVLTLQVEKDGKKAGEGALKPTGVMEFAGYTLEMKEMPFWARFYVRREQGIWLVYLGFAVASIAVIWRLIFYRREIVGAVRVEDGARQLVVAARSEYYKSLAEDEFTKLFQKLLTKSQMRDE